MITVTFNEVLKSIDLQMDSKGVELLRRRQEDAMNHVHIYATNDDDGLATVSPYPARTIYSELILQILPSEAWQEAQTSPEA